MTERELQKLEDAVALMRAAGRQKLPISLDVVDKIIAAERRHLRQKAA